MYIYLFITFAKQINLDTLLGKLLRRGFSPSSADPSKQLPNLGILALVLKVERPGPWGDKTLLETQEVLKEMDASYHSIVVYAETEVAWSNGSVSLIPPDPTRFDRIQGE